MSKIAKLSLVTLLVFVAPLHTDQKEVELNEPIYPEFLFLLQKGEKVLYQDTLSAYPATIYFSICTSVFLVFASLFYFASSEDLKISFLLITLGCLVENLAFFTYL